MGFLSLQILPSSAAKSVGTHKNHQRGKVGQSAGDTAMSLSNWKITEFWTSYTLQCWDRVWQNSSKSLTWIFEVWAPEIGTWLSSREVWGERLDEQDCSGSSLPSLLAGQQWLCPTNLEQLGEKKPTGEGYLLCGRGAPLEGRSRDG